MDITRARFAGSAASVEQTPKLKLPEFAFVGRSNVGKSSLINMLCNNATLAKTSSRPGKTLLINHFLINDAWYIVDLPGYGYANRSKTERANIRSIIDQYVSRSQMLEMLFVLLDSRLPLQKIDLEFINGLGEKGIPFSIVFTKGDKLGINALTSMVERNKKELLEYWEDLPPVFTTSSQTKMGREAIIDYIYEILKLVK
ncbi:MAG: YihA family ribosome biogenesis GTP-binding protein [Bacteroidetes bacterium]|uniref:Probable GTP-binding protein EngB n=1 Tax=Candidatus Egerieousia excrementavium TaxID=2840778 RepID=A0A9D9DJY1_9BACT|nr:YihA family ribosome biogenesis GTP-binding protein [Candidatus Egerieousia excrementavium]